jgi:glycosyltransferase involved in cell wall biosynthesis
LVRAWREHNLGELGALTVAGDGPERSALEQAAKGDPSIRFRGRVPDAELADMYRSASIFVLPSVSGEGFGLVAAEALASGVPVVTTDSGATGELVRDGVDGLVVAHRDADALGVSLRRLLSDTALRELMATEASKRRDGLGWESSIELLDRCLTDVSRETSD